jgi:uncharacterized membrane protein YhaH (DUF805 family)
MNQCSEKLKYALKVGALTAVFVFAGLISPFAFVTAPLSDAQVRGLYELSTLVAFIGFIAQVIRIMLRKQKP